MLPDLEYHDSSLLEWIYDHSGDGSELPGIDTLLTDNGLTGDSVRVFLTYLAERGLVKDHSTFGGPVAEITAHGIAWVQQARADRQSSARRTGALRTRMLLWLDEQERCGTQATDWSGFLSGPNAVYHEAPFTKQELTREAAYLKQRNLITAIDIEEAEPGFLQPGLTTDGRDCIIDHGGNVSDYNRGRTGGATTNVTMSDNSGNIVVAS